MEDDELQELEVLLNKKEDKRILVPQKMKITDQAREKARLLGPLVAKIGEGAFEWYGFALENIGDKDHIVRDVILAQNQNVSGGHVGVEGEKVTLASVEVKDRNMQYGTNHQIVGWIHNHADFGVHHSQMDEDNFLVVLNSTSLNTEVQSLRSLSIIESKPSQRILEDRILIDGKDDTDGAIEYLIKDSKAVEKLLFDYGIDKGDDPKRTALMLLNDLLHASKIDIKQARMTGFCYSIVVNNKGDQPHSEIAVIEEDVITRKQKMYTKNIPLEVVKVADDITLKQEEVIAEIKEKIIFPPKPIFNFGGLGRYGGKHAVYPYQYPYQGAAYNGAGYLPQGGAAQHAKHKGNGKVTISGFQQIPPAAEYYLEGTPAQPGKLPITHEELARRFAGESLEYMNKQFGAEYRQFMDELMGTLLKRREGLSKAAKSVGYLAKDETLAKPAFRNRVIDSLADTIDAKVKEGDTLATDFMLGFINSDHYSRDKVIDEYMPAMIGADPDVIRFCAEAVAYTSGYQAQGRCRDWMSTVLKTMANREGCTIEDAAFSAGTIGQGYKMNNVWLDQPEIKEASRIIWTGSYDERTLEFMRDFADPAKRENACISYSLHMQQRRRHDDELELEDLLKGPR